MGSLGSEPFEVLFVRIADQTMMESFPKNSSEQKHSEEKPRIVDTLEIAAGNFSLVKEIARVAEQRGERVDFGESVVVSDIDESDVRSTREDFEYDTKNGMNRPEVRFTVTDVAKMPFPDGSVGRVICSNFFSSRAAMRIGMQAQPGTSKAREYIREIHRVLVSGGLLLLHDTLSPEISDQLIKDGYFSEYFKDVSEKRPQTLGISPGFVGSIQNRHGEAGERDMKVFMKK